MAKIVKQKVTVNPLSESERAAHLEWINTKIAASKVYNVLPMGKPRMTQRDRWKKRPVVLRYHAFCDQVRELKMEVPANGAHIIFVLPMPDTWPQKKKAAMLKMPHQQKPDKDNMEKGLLDALLGEDSHIWDSRVTKIWGHSGAILMGKI